MSTTPIQATMVITNTYPDKRHRQETNLKELENKNKQTLVFKQRKRTSKNYALFGIFSLISIALGTVVYLIYTLPEKGIEATNILVFVPFIVCFLLSIMFLVIGLFHLFSINNTADLLSQIAPNNQTLLEHLYLTNALKIMDMQRFSMNFKHKQSSINVYSNSKDKPEMNGYYNVIFTTITKPFRPRLLQITVEKTLFACDTSKLPKTITTLLEEQAKLRNEITLNHSNNNNTTLLTEVVSNTKTLVENFNIVDSPTRHEVLPLEKLIAQMNEKLKEAINASGSLFKNSRINPNVLNNISSSMELSDGVLNDQIKNDLEII